MYAIRSYYVVMAVLNEEQVVLPTRDQYKEDKPQLSDDPWAGLLGDDS